MLAAALLVGAFAVAMLDRWRKRQLNETFTAHDQLTSFRLLYERGELSQEEFERVRKQLLTRLKRQEAARPAPPLDVLPEAPPEDPTAAPDDPPAPPAPAP
jgi:hypothetical protein